MRKGDAAAAGAWQAAGLADARLLLAGSWGLAEAKKRQLPANCEWLGPLSQERLRAVYRDTDVFVLPTNFEGSPLVIGEALACGLPVLTTRGRGADGILDEEQPHGAARRSRGPGRGAALVCRQSRSHSRDEPRGARQCRALAVAALPRECDGGRQGFV